MYGHLGGVPFAVEHGLRTEAGAKGNAIGAANQLAVAPGLDAVPPSVEMNLRVGSNELLADPVVPWPQAAPHDFFEGCVKADFKLALADGFRQGVGNSDSG